MQDEEYDRLQQMWHAVCGRDGEYPAHQDEWPLVGHNTKKLEKPVAAHFNQPDHSLKDLQVMGIEKINENITE